MSRELQNWLVEPLLDVGLDLEEIRSLVFRLGFEAVVCAERGTSAGVDRLVGEQPIEVQIAWAQMVDRLVIVGERAGWAAQESAAR